LIKKTIEDVLNKEVVPIEKTKKKREITKKIKEIV